MEHQPTLAPDLEEELIGHNKIADEKSCKKC